MRKMDKRIKKVTDIKTPFSEDFEELSNYIGFNVYGADDVNNFHNLETCFFWCIKTSIRRFKLFVCYSRRQTWRHNAFPLHDLRKGFRVEKQN